MYIISSFKLISGIYIVDQKLNLIFWDQINIPSLVLWFSQNFFIITQNIHQMPNSGNLHDKNQCQQFKYEQNTIFNLLLHFIHVWVCVCVLMKTLLNYVCHTSLECLSHVFQTKYIQMFWQTCTLYIGTIYLIYIIVPWNSSQWNLGFP